MSLPHPQIKRRRFDGLRLFSPGEIQWNHLTLPIDNLHPSLAQLRLLHLTDIHLTSSWFAAHDRLLQQISSAKLDLICFSGDLIENRWNPASALANAKRFIDGLRSRLGTFAIIGNHDGDLLAPHLARWNCHLLHAGRATIQLDGASMEIIGLPCVSRLDINRRLLGRFGCKPANTVRLVLAHYPDFAPRIGSLAADIILAGHTHGGQICLPGERAILTHDSLPRQMSSGVHRVNCSWLVVSRGVGFATIPIRLFAPPEVIELSLVPSPLI